MSFFIVWSMMLIPLWIIVPSCRRASICQVTKLMHMKPMLTVRAKSFYRYWNNSWARLRGLGKRNNSADCRIIRHQLAYCIFWNWRWSGILTTNSFVDDFIMNILINPTNFHEIIISTIRFDITAYFTWASSLVWEKNSLYLNLNTFEMQKKKKIATARRILLMVEQKYLLYEINAYNQKVNRAEEYKNQWRVVD